MIYLYGLFYFQAKWKRKLSKIFKSLYRDFQLASQQIAIDHGCERIRPIFEYLWPFSWVKIVLELKW